MFRLVANCHHKLSLLLFAWLATEIHCRHGKVNAISGSRSGDGGLSGGKCLGVFTVMKGVRKMVSEPQALWEQQDIGEYHFSLVNV